MSDVQKLLQGLQDLITGRTGEGPSSPVGAWGAQARADPVRVPSAGVGDWVLAVPAEGLSGVSDGVRLANAAKGEVYVCFEGPLGAQRSGKRFGKGSMWKFSPCSL